ncbi:MAG: alpha/beta fold hydrolase [Polymorphobacter sp.]
MSIPTAHRFASFDSVEIAWTELGAGAPVLLLHGLFSNAATNWLRYGAAEALAAAGFRIIMPDFRAHGASAAPHDAAAYPADVLAMDIEALVAHLGLTDFDLGGYSMGARTAVRLLARGMTPRRAILSGMGLAGLIESGTRTEWFLHVIANADSFERGSNGWFAAQFMKANNIDGAAVAHVLRAQPVTPIETVRALATPILVVCGKDDADNGSAPELAATLPHATYVEVPGNHMSAVTFPALGVAMAGFLTA